MAKSTRKKVTEENPVEQVPETVVETTESVTPEVVVEEPLVEPAPEPIVEAKVVVEEKSVKLKESDTSLSMEERIAAFVGRSGTVAYVKLNEFIKSLYPLPKYNEPPVWLSQPVSRQIRNLLTDMQSKGLITILDNRHARLGTAYYPDSTTLKTHYHNLNTVTLEAKGVDKK